MSDFNALPIPKRPVSPAGGKLVEGLVLTEAEQLVLRALLNAAALDGNQTLSGQKTFATAPRSTGEPDAATSLLNREQMDRTLLSKLKSRRIDLTRGNALNTGAYSIVDDGISTRIASSANPGGGAYTRRTGTVGRGHVGNLPASPSWGGVNYDGSELSLHFNIGGVDAVSRWQPATDDWGVVFGDHLLCGLTDAGVLPLVQTTNPTGNYRLAGLTCIAGAVRLWVKNGAAESTSGDVLMTLPNPASSWGDFELRVTSGTLYLYHNGALVGSLAGAPTDYGNASGVALALQTTRDTVTELVVNNLALSWI